MLKFDEPEKLGKLTIEITTDCNLKCMGCPRTVAIENNNWTNRSISLEKFKKILDHIPFTNMVTLHGIGEPMLHPEFLDIVKIAKQSGKFGFMKVTTNGITRSPDFMQKAIDAGLDQIWISVDSFDQIVAMQMRMGSNVEKLQRNIKECIERNIPIKISNVISRTNMYDIENLFTLLYELGNPTVYSQEFQDFGNDYGMLKMKDREMVTKTIERVRNKFPNISLVPPQFTAPEGNICMAPWSRPAISVEGYLTPCCTTFDPTHFGFADISAHSFSDLWKTEIVQDWLEKMYQNSIPMCNGCGLNPRLNRPDAQLSRSGKTGNELHVVSAS
jgi:MoaA/NifB/PqqE/SkfB family radical SAM enzyme